MRDKILKKMLEQGEIPLTEEVEGFTFAGGIMVIPRRSEHASMFGRVLLRNAQEKVTLALPINFGRRQQFVIEQQLRNTTGKGFIPEDCALLDCKVAAQERNGKIQLYLREGKTSVGGLTAPWRIVPGYEIAMKSVQAEPVLQQVRIGNWTTAIPIEGEEKFALKVYHAGNTAPYPVFNIPADAKFNWKNEACSFQNWAENIVSKNTLFLDEHTSRKVFEHRTQLLIMALVDVVDLLDLEEYSEERVLNKSEALWRSLKDTGTATPLKLML